MTIPGECPGACADERRLELIPAADHDALRHAREVAESEHPQLRAAVERFRAADPPVSDDGVDALRAASEDAARALAEVRQPERSGFVETADELVVAWWCPGCGGVDAPQPCIDVCIRRPVEWVNARLFAEEQRRHRAVIERNRRLVDTLVTLAFLTPRPGTEARNWQALQARARVALERDTVTRSG
jgi:hypothetical protein